MKDSPFSAMIPPTSTIPGSFMASAIPGAGVFNPVGVQTQQAANDKSAQSVEGMEAAAELTLQGEEMRIHTDLQRNKTFISGVTVIRYFSFSARRF